MGLTPTESKHPLGNGMAGRAADTLQSLPYRRHVQESQALGEAPMTPEQFARSQQNAALGR